MSKSAKKSGTAKPSKKPKSPPAAVVPINTARPGSKSYIIIELLGRPTGATVKELAAATCWQDHSVRGFLSGTLKKKLGHAVTSQVVDGIRHYLVGERGAGR